MNITESSYQGQVFSISSSPDGEYRFDFGNSGFALRCNGKDQPIGNNRTRVCVKSGVTILDITQKENGLKTRSTNVELSNGGKVLTSTVTEFGLNGPTITHQTTFSRPSGSSDFTGLWRDTIYLQQHADMTLRLDSQTLHIGYPSVGQQIDAPLNGAEAPVNGPSDGVTYVARVAGRREFLYLTKRSGKILSQGSLKLGNNARDIIDTWWNPDRPSDKGTLVYERR